MEVFFKAQIGADAGFETPRGTQPKLVFSSNATRGDNSCVL